MDEQLKKHIGAYKKMINESGDNVRVTDKGVMMGALIGDDEAEECLNNFLRQKKAYFRVGKVNSITMGRVNQAGVEFDVSWEVEDNVTGDAVLLASFVKSGKGFSIVLKVIELDFPGAREVVGGK